MICLSSAGDLTRFQVERVTYSIPYSPRRGTGFPQRKTGEQGEYNAGSSSVERRKARTIRAATSSEI